LSVASVFVAQLAGVELSLGQQLMMMLTLMLTSKGVAGVPRAALVVLTATLTTFASWAYRWKAPQSCSASTRCWTWDERP